MSCHHFSSFSFVDSIDLDKPNGLIRGSFRIPSYLHSFPQSLVAEAIGQLAAWYAMSASDFMLRPVAALAGETRYHSEAKPGHTLKLFANIMSCDSDSVSYSGWANVDGRLVLELVDCFGAMLPQDDFDDPLLLKQHFQILRTVGAKENRLVVAPQILATDLNYDNIGNLRGILNVPLRADFFADHFPRKPVLPASLLMHSLSAMVLRHVNSTVDHCDLTVVSIDCIKVRSWISPGQQVTLMAEGISASVLPKLLKLSARLGTKMVASALLRLNVLTSSTIT